jgi:hypothetical protein
VDVHQKRHQKGRPLHFSISIRMCSEPAEHAGETYALINIDSRNATMFMDADGPAGFQKQNLSQVLDILWHVVSPTGVYHESISGLMRAARPGLRRRFQQFCEWVILMAQRHGRRFEAGDPVCAENLRQRFGDSQLNAREIRELVQQDAALRDVLADLVPADIISEIMARRCSDVCRRPVPLQEWVSISQSS